MGISGDLKGNAKPFGDLDIYQLLSPGTEEDTNLVVAASGDPASLASAERSDLDARSEAPVTDVTTLDAAMTETMSRPRFNLILLAVFAAIGLALAALGIYGVISVSVGQRTQKIGLRMALGALPSDIRRAVVGEALTLTTIGLAVGMAGAVALTGVMRAMLSRRRRGIR